jgi:hypothetical protein
VPSHPPESSDGTPISARDDQPRSRARLYRTAGTMIGLALLAAAVVMVARHHMTIRAALHSVADQPPLERARLIAAMLVSLLGNIVLTASVFQILMSRCVAVRPVGTLEMQAVIASAGLVNYLPLGPGLVSRMAYHKAVNGIALSDSARAMMQAIALSAATAGYLMTLVLLTRNRPVSPWPLVLAPIALLPLAGLMMRGVGRVIAFAAAVRLCDVLLTAVRYHAAFALIGSPIDWTGSLAFACISVVTTMVPLLSNGMGLREWSIGLLAPVIAAYQMELGLTADLLNRAAELVVAALAGVPATLWLARHVRAVRAK